MGKTLALLDCPDPNNNPEIGMEKFSEVMPAEPPFNFSQFLRRVLVLSASQRKQAEKKRAAKNAEIYGTVISAPMTEAEAIAADIHNKHTLHTI